jgi:hypothetical protein
MTAWKIWWKGSSDRSHATAPPAREMLGIMWELRPPLGAAVLACLAVVTVNAQPAIQQAWDELIGTGVSQATPDPVLTPRQAQGRGGTSASDFADHFFFEGRVDYWRYSTSFTGLPTTTSVINAPFTGIFNPGGIPYPDAFQPVANRVEGLIDWGTRGYLSDRVNTHFTLRYAQDVSSVVEGAPAQDIIETFGGNREYQFLTASVEIRARPTDGVWAGTSLTLGRQDIYGAELAPLDGAELTINRQSFELSVFGGRRFSFYSDPDQRAIGGANLLLRVNPETSVELSTLWYIRGTNRITVRRSLGPRWVASSYLRSYGGAPVDFSAQALYASNGGKTSLRAGFFQKLTNKDYSYDYTEAARNLDPNNALSHLYLGPLAQYSQFSIDARQAAGKQLRLGGAVVARRLNDSNDQGAFDTSFEDYRASAQIYPWRKIEMDVDYHQRNSDRLSPLTATTFDDMQAVGETSVKDTSLSIRRGFREGRVSVNGGVYYRRISIQDRFYLIDKAHQSGWTAGAALRVDRHTRLYADYSLDNDFFVFKPDIANSRALRTGVAWRF